MSLHFTCLQSFSRLCRGLSSRKHEGTVCASPHRSYAIQRRWAGQGSATSAAQNAATAWLSRQRILLAFGAFHTEVSACLPGLSLASRQHHQRQHEQRRSCQYGVAADGILHDLFGTRMVRAASVRGSVRTLHNALRVTHTWVPAFCKTLRCVHKDRRGLC